MEVGAHDAAVTEKTLRAAAEAVSGNVGANSGNGTLSPRQ
jgi:hypothetical protein